MKTTLKKFSRHPVLSLLRAKGNNLFDDRFTCRFAFKSHFAVLIVRCLIFTLASKRLSNLDGKQTLSLILISFLHCCFCNRINLKVSYSVSQINDECLRKTTFIFCSGRSELRFSLFASGLISTLRVMAGGEERIRWITSLRIGHSRLHNS